MRKKWTLGLFCLAVLLVGGSGFNRHARTSPRTPPPAHEVRHVPEHTAYNFLFRTADFVRTEPAEAGRAPSRSRVLQKEAALSDEQYRTLEQIAADTLGEVERQDARARELIKEFRARYPNGVVPRGHRLPEPPPELRVMQQERNALLLRGRDRLRAAFGPQEFARLHGFTMRRFAGAGLGERGRE